MEESYLQCGYEELRLPLKPGHAACYCYAPDGHGRQIVIVHQADRQGSAKGKLQGCTLRVFWRLANCTSVRCTANSSSILLAAGSGKRVEGACSHRSAMRHGITNCYYAYGTVASRVLRSKPHRLGTKLIIPFR
jgi:hypothetical protein